MADWRLLPYLRLVIGLLLAYTLAYQRGRATFEGEPRSSFEALAIVVETFTTTGYGEDGGLWSTSVVQVPQIVVQLSGATVLFLAFPPFVAPWVEQRLEKTVPTAVDGYGDYVAPRELAARSGTRIADFDTWDREHAIVEFGRLARCRGSVPGADRRGRVGRRSRGRAEPEGLLLRPNGKR